MSDSWPRRRLLAILRGASEPLDAQELAQETGQHVTTVRFHLDVLTKESLVRQFQQPPRGRGRPRIGYAAVRRSIGYQELAQVLADQLGPDPQRREAAAVAAGRAWGARLDTTDQTIESLDDAKDVTMSLLSELGFAPEREFSADTAEQILIRLTACPLRELARTHSEVVCGVHLGLIKEVLDRNGARDDVDVRLDPFVEPEQCIVHLRASAARERAKTADPVARPEPPLTPSASLATPSGSRVPPQVRNADPDVAKQPTQQW